MPYNQYDVHLETQLAASPHKLEVIEKNEETQFNNLLSREQNRIIDLLDHFFPPRFKKKPGGLELYPTLPCTVQRKRTLEFLQQRIKSRQIKLDGYVDNISELDNLAAEVITPHIKHSYPYFRSYAVVAYDHTGKALVDNTSVLGSLIDTVTFVELTFEYDLLPFELLNFEIILNLYLEWNKKQLDHLSEKMKVEEGWLLIDAVSYAAGLYAMKSEVTNAGYINGFLLEISLSKRPLRSRQEIPENMWESSCFQRPKGQIDNNKIPKKILNLQKHWNKVCRNAIEAMKFGDINHTGGENVNRSDTRVREKDFFKWAKKRGYQYPSSLSENYNSTPKELGRPKPSRTASELGKLGSKKSNERHDNAKKLALEVVTPFWEQCSHKTKEDMASLVLAEFHKKKILNVDEPYAASTIMEWIKEAQPANKKRGGRPKKPN